MKNIKVDSKKGIVKLDFRVHGRRYRRTFKGGHALGERMLHKLKAEYAEQDYLPERKKQKLTFVQAADKYWAVHLSKKKGAKKLKYTLEAIKKYFGNKQLAKITTEDVQQFYNKKLEKTSPSTANRHFTTLRAVINKAVKLKLYKGENPCNGVDKEKENPARTNYLDADQICDLISFAPVRSKNLIALAIGTGMRRGEILRLDWNDIDLGNGIIHIHLAKSGEPRNIPIIRPLRHILLGMKQRSGRVFPLTEKMVEYDFKQARNKAGLTELHFHDLRHTFASHFMMNGGSLTYLQSILGHADLKMTQRYAHFSPTYLQQAIKVVDNLIPQLTNNNG